MLFWEGDPGDSFCVVTEGKVIIETADAQGKAITLAVLAEGEAFGEQSLLKDEPVRTATARALGGARVISISRAAFDLLRRANPVFDRFLLSVLTERVDRLSALVLEMAHLPAEERVLRRIAYLGALFEPALDGSRMLPLSQEQWANLAGTTRVTVNRALRRLERDGAIEIRRGGLLLRDLAALDSAAS
ncbi:MAG: cAMP-activated global transcriptional regulator CRP [Acidimicrobiales bacterium]|nr:cAMP-activated global transcriptional regulator CRP [Acidimicrobiales bacterium]